MCDMRSRMGRALVVQRKEKWKKAHEKLMGGRENKRKHHREVDSQTIDREGSWEYDRVQRERYEEVRRTMEGQMKTPGNGLW